MKILLINAPFESDLLDKVGSIFFREIHFPEPLALELLAANLEGDHDIEIADLRFEKKGIEELIKSSDPDIIGLTCLTMDVYSAVKVIKKIKKVKPDILMVLGGVHPTLIPDDLKNNFVDVIVLGEGEKIFGKIVNQFSKGSRNFSEIENIFYRDPVSNEFKFTRTSKELLDLNQLKSPRRDLVKKYKKNYGELFGSLVEGSRGCPYECKFCYVKNFHTRKYRCASIDKIFSLINEVEDKLITFVDDNFFYNKKISEPLAKLLLKEGIKKNFNLQARSDLIAKNPGLIELWKKAGLLGIKVGFDGFDETYLKKVNKHCNIDEIKKSIKVMNDNDILIWGSLIVDNNFDLDDFERIQKFIDENPIDLLQLNILTPLPGTDYLKEVKDIINCHDYRLYDCQHTVIPTKLPIKQFYKEYSKLWNNLNRTTFKKVTKLLLQKKIKINHSRIILNYWRIQQDYRVYLKAHKIYSSKLNEYYT